MTERTPAVNGLHINEIMTSNSSDFTDAQGHDYDWIEIYNGTDSTLNLENFSVSLNTGDTSPWYFGSEELHPKEYTIVFASSLDKPLKKFTPDPRPLPVAEVTQWTTGIDHESAKVTPYKFKSIDSQEGEYTQISAKISLFKDKTAGIVLTTKEQDFSDFNQLTVKGFIEKNKKIHIYFKQACNKNFFEKAYPIVGTGKDNDTYIIPFELKDSLINTTCITAIEIQSAEMNEEIAIHLEKIMLTHSGYYQHTNFKLKSNPTTLFFRSPTGELIDSITIPPLPQNISYGRSGEKGWNFYSNTTPLAKNSSIAYSGITKNHHIVTKGGFYNDEVLVELRVPDGVHVYYTRDGSLPTNQSSRFYEPVRIRETTTLRTVSYKDGELFGEVQTETYFIKEMSTLPIISIAVDPYLMFDDTVGIYSRGPHASNDYPYFGANFWEDKEIPAHVEFFERNRNEGFSQQCGLKIHGGWTRALNKKSLALMFKDKYGGDGELNYALFPKAPELKRFKGILLRTGGNKGDKAIINDCFHSELMSGTSVAYQKNRPVIVYINGRYYGFFNIREKLTADFIETNFNIPSNEIDMIKDYGTIQAGSSQSYNSLLNFLKDNQTIGEKEFAYIQTQMDIQNYIEYMAGEIFVMNDDWPANNIKYWRHRNGDKKWRWIMYDTDGLRFDINKNMFKFATNDQGGAWPNGPKSTFLFRSLLKSPDFRKQFHERFEEMLEKEFHPDRLNRKLKSLLAPLDKEIERDVNRWKRDIGRYHEGVQELELFSNKRTAIVKKQLEEFFERWETQ